MRVQLVARTDIGLNREQNEDSFAICPDLTSPNWDQTESCVDIGEYGSLLVVTDGMGGTNAGEVASNLAIETIKKQFTVSNIAPVINDEKHIVDFLSTTIGLADQAINEAMAQRPEIYGMGTTIVVCWLLNGKAHVAWCGDSRCYVFNKKTGLKALTKDHSLVQERIDLGELTKEEAFTHPDNNIITRGLGDFDTGAVPDTVIHPISPNDIILLCSDGLCGYCNDQTIEKVIKANRNHLNHCCDELLKAALKAEAEDNITVALASLSDNAKKFHLFSIFK